MDSMEKSHALQSSVVSALFNARQLIWTEMSSVISDIREQFDHANKDRNGEIDRLLNENRSLTDLFNRLNEIVEGKEIEIHGLRRQLQSFYTAKPLCSNCSRDITLSDKTTATREHGHPAGKLSPRRSRAYRNYFGQQSEVRKRLRSNTSLSSSSPVSANIGRGLVNTFPSRWETKPAQKRQCTRASLDAAPAFPIVLVRDTQALDEEDDDFYEKPTRRTNVSPARPVAPLRERNANVGVVAIKKKQPITPKGRAFRITEFSPPTQQFDASLAIENAVNHSDLAAIENTRLDSNASMATYVREDTADEQESITLSIDTQKETSKFVFRRPLPNKSRSRMVASQLLYRRLGVGLRARRNRRTVRAKHPKVSKQKDLDEAATDASLPSDFLESECSLRIPDIKPVIDPDMSPIIPQLSKEPVFDSENHLPSIGGSPTALDRQLFKRPKLPPTHTTCSPKPVEIVIGPSTVTGVDDYYASVGLSSPEVANRIHRCSRHRALPGPPPSTPKGFWEIGIPDSECPAEAEDAEKEQTKRSRRRRPLNFPTDPGLAADSARPHRFDAHLRDASSR